MITLDVQNKPLGRAATEAAIILRGKNEPSFLPNVLPTHKLKIINFDKIYFSEKKKKQKVYKTYSGYPGGLKEIPYKKMEEKDSKEIFRKAVYGMLPKNKLRARIIKNLIIE